MPLLNGTPIVASISGTVSYTGFNGSGGYTIIIENNEFSSIYCHVSPIFLVQPGQFILPGYTIATVGPKNVYNVPNNPYKDLNGNPTNGVTTGSHLHFALKKDGKAVNPLIYMNYMSSSSFSQSSSSHSLQLQSSSQSSWQQEQ